MSLGSLSNLRQSLEKYWWLRGAFFFVSITGILAHFSGQDASKLLLVFHSTILAWNKLTGLVGGLLGALPFIPTMDSATVNTLILLPTLAMPAQASAMSKLDYKKVGVDLWYAKNQTDIFLMIASMDFLKAIFKFALLCGAALLPIGFYGTLVALANSDSAFLMTAMMLLFLAYAGLCAYMISLRHPSYIKGVISTVIGMLVLEIWHQIHTPVISDAIDAYICWANNNKLQQCSTS